MDNPLIKMLDILLDYIEKLKTDIENDISLENAAIRISAIAPMLDKVQGLLSPEMIKLYMEQSSEIKDLCISCQDVSFLGDNLQNVYDALTDLLQQLERIKNKMNGSKKRCPCCGHSVEYLSLDHQIRKMNDKYGHSNVSGLETLNVNDHSCPVCNSSDADRMIVSFLKSINLSVAPEGTRLLQVSAINNIDEWVRIWCPNVIREEVKIQNGVLDLHDSDICNNNAGDGLFDVVICSGVLECVKDDRKMISDLYRLLKNDGLIILNTSVELCRDEIDEGSADSPKDKWIRFGDENRCRLYSKKGLLDRLEECFFVRQFDKEYFGDEIFETLGLSETSVLYVLTKTSDTAVDKGWMPKSDPDLCVNGPLVSVVLPTYNHEKYVARAIESVLNQTYRNIEILVADDGSSDRTPEIVRSYSGHFAKEYYFTENLRGRATFLATQAKGKYIALMHSDDYWEPDKIAVQVYELEKKGGISLTWADYISDNGETLENATFYKKNRSRIEWLRYLWEKGNCFCNPSCVMSKELYLRERIHGFSSKQLPDYFKWIDYLMDTEINVVPYPLTKMGVHYDGAFVNDSAPTKENKYRHILEDGIHWMAVLDDMDDELFIEVFKDKFKNANASKKDELMCERYFLMRDSGMISRESAAINYMAIKFHDLQNCLKDNYGYTKNSFAEDEISKGFIHAFLNAE